MDVACRDYEYVHVLKNILKRDEMMGSMNNIIGYSDYEFSPQKLLLNGLKCQNIFGLLSGEREFDDLFPISIELHLTNECNLNCDWCVDREIRTNKESLRYETVIKLLDDLQGKNIGITVEGGGEPTLYKYFDNFVRAAHERNINLGLISNGVRPIDIRIANCFKWIRISLDSSSPEEYFIEKRVNAFHKVMANIRNICSEKGETIIGVSYVLNTRNVVGIPDFLNELQEIGLDYVQIRHVEENPHLKISHEQIEEFSREISGKFHKKTMNLRFNSNSTGTTCNNNMPCVAHSLRSIIHADGEVFLCEKRRHDLLTFGNINDYSFLDIWRSEKRKNATKKLLDPKNQNGCTECRITNYNQIFNDLIRIRTGSFI